MNRTAVAVCIIVLVGLLVVLNMGIQKSSPTEDEANQQAQEQASKTPAPTPAAAPVTGKVGLAPEVSVGDPAKARVKVVIGWRYDPTTQANPQAAAQAIQQLQQIGAMGHGMVAAEVVNLDVPSKDRSPAAAAVTQEGLSVNGKLVAPGILGQGNLAPSRIMPTIMSAASSAGGAPPGSPPPGGPPPPGSPR